MRIRTLFAAGALALATLSPQATLAQDQASPGLVNPLKGAMADLAGLLGTWGASDTELAPDGSVANEEKGALITFTPALAGSYMFMHVEARQVNGESEPMIWIITHDPDRESFIARGFGANDPHAAVALGSWDGQSFVLQRDPETNVPPMNFRITLTLDGASTINVGFEIEYEEQWIKRSRGVWTRLD